MYNCNYNRVPMHSLMSLCLHIIHTLYHYVMNISDKNTSRPLFKAFNLSINVYDIKLYAPAHPLRKWRMYECMFIELQFIHIFSNVKVSNTFTIDSLCRYTYAHMHNHYHNIISFYSAYRIITTTCTYSVRHQTKCLLVFKLI